MLCVFKPEKDIDVKQYYSGIRIIQSWWYYSLFIQFVSMMFYRLFFRVNVIIKRGEMTLMSRDGVIIDNGDIFQMLLHVNIIIHW